VSKVPDASTYFTQYMLQVHNLCLAGTSSNAHVAAETQHTWYWPGAFMPEPLVMISVALPEFAAPTHVVL
jgi:hypothetical protein